jgi:hypothetical protein
VGVGGGVPGPHWRVGVAARDPAQPVPCGAQPALAAQKYHRSIYPHRAAPAARLCTRFTCTRMIARTGTDRQTRIYILASGLRPASNAPLTIAQTRHIHTEIHTDRQTDRQIHLPCTAQRRVGATLGPPPKKARPCLGPPQRRQTVGLRRWPTKKDGPCRARGRYHLPLASRGRAGRAYRPSR